MSERVTNRIKSWSRIPDGIRIYVTGDVHGRADLLSAQFRCIDSDCKDKEIRIIHVFLGDYFDRGPDSAGVVDLLIERSHLYRTVFLKGNHEILVKQFLDDPRTVYNWRKYGGGFTLASYGLGKMITVQPLQVEKLSECFGLALPVTHRRFLDNLELTFSCGDYVFAHAGIRPGVPLDRQCEDDVCWIRDEFLNYRASFGKRIVHGHTPVREPDIRENRINIDTGAYVSNRLTCLRIEGDEIFFL